MLHVYNLSEIFHHFRLIVKYVTESTNDVENRYNKSQLCII